MNQPAADPLHQAAALTFAMLRFEQDAAHERHSATPDNLRAGHDFFTFLPSWQRTMHDDVVPFLAALPSPALIYPTTTRGVATLVLLDELTGDRRKWGQKTLDNQLAGINELAAQFMPALTDDSNILLEFGGEAHVVSLATLRFWSQRFSAPVGWNFSDSRNDPRAAARLQLIASDGRVNPEWMAVAPWHRPVA